MRYELNVPHRLTFPVSTPVQSTIILFAAATASSLHSWDKLNAGGWLDACSYFDQSAWATVLFEITLPRYAAALLILNDESCQAGRNAFLIALNIGGFEKYTLVDALVSEI